MKFSSSRNTSRCPSKNRSRSSIAGTNGYLDPIPVSELRAFETELYSFLEARHPEILRNIAEKKQLDDALKASLNEAVKQFATDFAAQKGSRSLEDELDAELAEPQSTVLRILRFCVQFVTYALTH